VRATLYQQLPAAINRPGNPFSRFRRHCGEKGDGFGDAHLQFVNARFVILKLGDVDTAKACRTTLGLVGGNLNLS
jgi:hypothetical protein